MLECFELIMFKFLRNNKLAQLSTVYRYVRQIILKLACDVGHPKAVQYAKDLFYRWMHEKIT